MNEDEFMELDDFVNDDYEVEETISDNDQFEETLDYDYQEEDNPSLIEQILRNKGISDINKINFETEDGQIEKRAWDDLTREEQITMLTDNSDPDYDLEDDEIDLINTIRTNKLTPKEYINALRQQGVEYGKQQSQIDIESVDELNDDELYVLNLLQTSSSITDDEAAEALKIAKQNPTIYAKQIEGLRNSYRMKEDEQRAQQEAEQREQHNQQMAAFANALNNSLYNFKSVGEMDLNLEQDDLEEIKEFIMGKDSAGLSWFGRALNDPDQVVKMAWFALKGEEAFNSINDYIKNQITLSYNRGLEAGRNNSSSSRVVRKVNSNQKTTKNPNRDYLNLEDIF